MTVAILEHAAIGRPITRLGASIYPIYLLGQSTGFSFTTGITPDVTISEKVNAEVPTLQVTNLGGIPVLIPEGQVLDGGRQTRTTNVSILVPAGATIDIPVSCVEAGRWGGSDGFYDSNRKTSRRVRRAKQMGVRENIQSFGSRNSDQSDVWNAVDRELFSRNVNSKSANFRDLEGVMHENSDIAGAIEDLVSRGPMPEQRGIVVTHGTRVVSAEFYATNSALQCNWEALIRGVIMDAPGQESPRPSAAAVLKFLRRLATSEIITAPGVGLGVEEHIKSSHLVGHSLSVDDTLVHASAFALTV